MHDSLITRERAGTGGPAPLPGGHSVHRAALLYQRFRQLIHEAAKFGIVGFAGVLVNLGVTDWAHFSLGVDAVEASILGGVVSTILAFLGNRYWSFRNRERIPIARETTMFVVLNGIGIAIQALTIYLFKHDAHVTTGLPYTAANMLGILLGTVFRWWSYRKWVWLAKQPRGRAARGRAARGRAARGRAARGLTIGRPAAPRATGQLPVPAGLAYTRPKDDPDRREHRHGPEGPVPCGAGMSVFLRDADEVGEPAGVSGHVGG